MVDGFTTKLRRASWWHNRFCTGGPSMGTCKKTCRGRLYILGVCTLGCMCQLLLTIILKFITRIYSFNPRSVPRNPTFSDTCCSIHCPSGVTAFHSFCVSPKSIRGKTLRSWCQSDFVSPRESCRCEIGSVTRWHRHIQGVTQRAIGRGISCF